MVFMDWILENSIPIIALMISGWALWRTQRAGKLELDQTQIKMWSDLIRCNSDTSDDAVRAALALLWVEGNKPKVPAGDKSLLLQIDHAIEQGEEIESTVADADEQLANAGEPFTRQDIVNLQDALSAQELYRSMMASILANLKETRDAMKEAINDSSSDVSGG